MASLVPSHLPSLLIPHTTEIVKAYADSPCPLSSLSLSSCGLTATATNDLITLVKGKGKDGEGMFGNLETLNISDNEVSHSPPLTHLLIVSWEMCALAAS